MIRFSVVTITYNAEKVLQRTLDSVCSQTYEGVEHLIVDGASKDRTLALAEQYKQRSDSSDNKHKVITISTMKVDWPPARSSEAPMRVKSLSTTPIRAERAGTKLPIWAIRTISAT